MELKPGRYRHFEGGEYHVQGIAIHHQSCSNDCSVVPGSRQKFCLQWNLEGTGYFEQVDASTIKFGKLFQEGIAKAIYDIAMPAGLNKRDATARGLRLRDYRRWGLSPRPENFLIGEEGGQNNLFPRSLNLRPSAYYRVSHRIRGVLGVPGKTER